MKSVRFGILICAFLILNCVSENRNVNRSNEKEFKNCKSDFGLYAFLYGRSSYPDRFLNVEENRGSREIVYLFYLIRVPGRNILVDSGFLNDSYEKNSVFSILKVRAAY